MTREKAVEVLSTVSLTGLPIFPGVHSNDLRKHHGFSGPQLSSQTFQHITRLANLPLWYTYARLAFTSGVIVVLGFIVYGMFFGSVTFSSMIVLSIPFGGSLLCVPAIIESAVLHKCLRQAFQYVGLTENQVDKAEVVRANPSSTDHSLLAGEIEDIMFPVYAEVWGEREANQTPQPLST